MATKHVARARPKATSSPELEKECTAILDLLANEEDEHWQIGMHYNRIVDGRLAQAAGYPSAQEFASQRLAAISHATLSRYSAIARAFPEEVAKKYRSSLLAELLTYERISQATLPHGDQAQVPIKVPNADGSTENKHFADSSVEDLRSAVHRLHGHEQKPIPVDDKRIIDALRKTLERMLGSADIPIAMHERRGPADTFVAFNLPVNYLEMLRDVLVSVLRKPGDVAVQSVQGKSRGGKIATKNGRRWSGRAGGSKTSKTAKSVHRALAPKNKQMSRGNIQPRRP